MRVVELTNKRDDRIFDRFKDYVKQFPPELQIIIGNEYAGLLAHVPPKVMFLKHALHSKGPHSVVTLAL